MDFDLIYKQYFRDVFLYLRSLSANEDIFDMPTITASYLLLSIF